MATESGEEITEPWFQRYKLGVGITFSSCQQMGAEMGEIVICEGKWHGHWSWLIWYVSRFILPVYCRSSMDTLTAVPKTVTGAVYATASLFCQGDFSSRCKHDILPCRCQCWLSGSAHLCFPCSSHTWLCSQLCSSLANSLSASFTSQWLPNAVPKFRSSPPLWLAAQFAAVFSDFSLLML